MTNNTKVYGSRWERLDSCGQGGQGYVFKARDISGRTAEICAIKFIINKDRIERYRNEIHAMKSLSHEHVMPIIDYSLSNDVDADDNLFIVMPFMRGGDLSKRIASFSNSLDSVCEIGRKLAIGLEYMHSNDIIHRDIKPKNILFNSDDNNPVIADFGICYRFDQSYDTDSAEIVGARFYTAPELEEPDRPEPTARSDVYSLGKVLFFLFTGGKVIPREDLSKSNYDTYFNNSVRHQMFKNLIASMIAAPENRIGSMEIVKNEIIKIQDWDMQIGISLLSDRSLGHIQQTISHESKVQDLLQKNTAIVASRRQIRNDFIGSFSEWLGKELAQIAVQCSVNSLISIEQVTLSEHEIKNDNLIFPQLDKMLRCYSAIGLKSSLSSDRIHKIFMILFTVFCDTRVFLSDVDSLYYETTDNYFIKLIPIYQIKTIEEHLMSRSFLVRDMQDASVSGSIFRCDPSLTVAPSTIALEQFDVKSWPSNIEAIKNLIRYSLDIYFSTL